MSYERKQPTASAFKTERETKFNWQVSGDSREPVTPEQLTNSIVDGFKEEPVMNEYIEAMKLNGINVDKAEVNTHWQRILFSLHDAEYIAGGQGCSIRTTIRRGSVEAGRSPVDRRGMEICLWPRTSRI
jgi:hypothetical protein